MTEQDIDDIRCDLRKIADRIHKMPDSGLWARALEGLTEVNVALSIQRVRMKGGE